MNYGDKIIISVNLAPYNLIKEHKSNKINTLLLSLSLVLSLSFFLLSLSLYPPLFHCRLNQFVLDWLTDMEPIIFAEVHQKLVSRKSLQNRKEDCIQSFANTRQRCFWIKGDWRSYMIFFFWNGLNLSYVPWFPGTLYPFVSI